jgi:glutaredoxin
MDKKVSVELTATVFSHSDPERCRQCASPKRWLSSKRLHGFTAHFRKILKSQTNIEKLAVTQSPTLLVDLMHRTLQRPFKKYLCLPYSDK